MKNEIYSFRYTERNDDDIICLYIYMIWKWRKKKKNDVGKKAKERRRDDEMIMLMTNNNNVCIYLM